MRTPANELAQVVPARTSSKTAAIVCAARAIGVSGALRDPIAARLLPAWLQQRLPWFGSSTRGVQAVRTGLRYLSLGIIDHNTVRMLLVDQQIASALADGARQLVILGAGLDARAYRLPGLEQCRVFEVDHPASQADKRARTANLVPRALDVRYVAADFEASDLEAALLEQGFERDAVTVWVCEGVTPYLSKGDVVRLLQVVASLSAPGSSLSLSYLAPAAARGQAERSLPSALVKLLGERAKGSLSQREMQEALEELGLAITEDLAWDEWVARVPNYQALPNLLKERLVVARRPGRAVLVEAEPEAPQSKTPRHMERAAESRPARASDRPPSPQHAPQLVADALVEALEQVGVRAAFGVTGGAFGVIFDRLSRSELIRVYHGQHEGSAAYAAMGRAMLTAGRELTVCFSTAGPGITNLITGVAAAFAESVPLLVLTGNSPTTARNAGALQDAHAGGIDALRMFDRITVANACVERAEDVLPTLREFARLSLTQRKPVHLNIPIDVSNQPAIPGALAPVCTLRRGLDTREHAALQRFLSAERPLLFIGNGVKLSNLSEEVEHIAARHRLPVLVTCHGRGAIREEHSCFFGTFGFASDGSGRAFLERYRPDAVLFLGTGLGEMATSGWSRLLEEPEWKVHVDIDAAKFNRAYSMNATIENDIQVVLQTLGEQRPRVGDLPPPNRISAIVPRLVSAGETDLVHPARLFESLSDMLPDNALIFAEPGNSMAWAFKHLRLRGTQQLHVPLGLAAMGSAIGAAIGAASAATGRPIVCVAGDCATLMSGNELKTAVEYNLPLTVVILNDGGHGMVQHGSQLVGLKNIQVRFEHRVDFLAYARALGIPSHAVSTQRGWNQFDLSERMLSFGPSLVEVHLDPAAVPPLADRAKILSLAPAPPEGTEPPAIAVHA